MCIYSHFSYSSEPKSKNFKTEFTKKEWKWSNFSESNKESEEKTYLCGSETKNVTTLTSFQKKACKKSNTKNRYLKGSGKGNSSLIKWLCSWIWPLCAWDTRPSATNTWSLPFFLWSLRSNPARKSEVRNAAWVIRNQNQLFEFLKKKISILHHHFFQMHHLACKL